jgi:hypothetical protein
MTDRSLVKYRHGSISQRPDRLYKTTCATAVRRNPDQGTWEARGTASRIVLAE